MRSTARRSERLGADGLLGVSSSPTLARLGARRDRARDRSSADNGIEQQQTATCRAAADGGGRGQVSAWRELRPTAFEPRHAPPNLTEDWAQRHLTALPGVDLRLLRRGIAVKLVQHTGNHTLDDAAEILQLPRVAASLAIRTIANWAALDPERNILLATAANAILDTIAASARDALFGRRADAVLSLFIR